MSPTPVPDRASQRTFHLRSIHARVPCYDVLVNPLLSDLMVDDTCWCAAMADLQARRPGRWQLRRRRNWNAELFALLQEQMHIQERAARLGLFA